MANPYASSSLYVGDLRSDVAEHHLYDLFTKVGGVASVRVCRDSVTRRSLGYAYVNFHKTDDAERAIDTMNYSMINGHPCRIMWSHRDPATRKSGVGDVFVSNLDVSVDSKVLHDTFSAFGSIVSCKVAQNSEGHSLGHGFVQFETDEFAQKAIRDGNGHQLNGKEMKVVQFQPRKKKDEPIAKQEFTNVFLKNLDESVDDAKLLELMAPFGKVTRQRIMRDVDGKSRCFGFANFESPEQAKIAVEGLNGKKVGAKEIFVGRAMKKSERAQYLKQQYESVQGTNVYVKHLDDTFDDKKLQETFAQFGEITSVKVMRDEGGISKGFGFVSFHSVEDAQKAIQAMNNAVVGSKKLYVAPAQRKEERRQSLESYFYNRPFRGRGGPDNVPAAAGPMYPPPMYYPPGAYPQPMPGARPPYYMYPGMSYPMGPQGIAPPQGGPRMPRRAPGQAPPRMGGPPPMVPMAGGPMMPTGPQMMGPDGKRVPIARPPPQRAFQYNKNVVNREPAAPMGMPMGAMPMQVGMPGQMVMPAQMVPMMLQQPLVAPPVMAPSIPQPIAAPAGVPSVAEPLAPLDLKSINSMNPTEQRNAIGERLFHLIQQSRGELAGKITGMLLEMELAELISLLETPAELEAKVKEAYDVLQQSEEKGGEVASPAAPQVPPVPAP